MNESLCRNCGRTEDGHCTFEPKSCPCDDRTWADRPGPICDKYTVFESTDSNCTRCEHDKECHAGNNELIGVG